VKPANRPYVYMGDLNEKHYEPDIFELYGDVKRTGKKELRTHFKIYDWVNQDYKIELKSRNNEYAVFPDTMIGWNKVEEWGKDETDKRYYFLFGFLDGLYEWELTQASYDALPDGCVRKVKVATPTTEYTTFNEEKEHLYIPIENLKKINDKGCIVPDDLLSKSRRVVKSNCWLFKK
jgi:hypothetical protein